MSLDDAMTNKEAHPHLVKAYKNVESPALNGHMYRVKEDYMYWALEWVRERGINSRWK